MIHPVRSKKQPWLVLADSLPRNGLDGDAEVIELHDGRMVFAGLHLIHPVAGVGPSAEIEFEVFLPTKRALCSRCDGRGVHDHEAFSDGITMGEFAEDPDFHEAYMRGAYDVKCSECNGERVVTLIDEGRVAKAIGPDLAELFFEYQTGVADDRAQAAWERKMGY